MLILKLMFVNLTEFYFLQKKLDKDIAERHNITYESTFLSRILALIVELGELANETRCFKFWSLNKKTDKEKILEEYIDGLHFLLSIGIFLKSNKMIYEVELTRDEIKNKDLISAFLDVYDNFIKLKTACSINQHEKAFLSYLKLMIYFDFNFDEIYTNYLRKLKINYNRQESGY